MTSFLLLTRHQKGVSGGRYKVKGEKKQERKSGNGDPSTPRSSFST